jgi:Omp85 superfamily domain
VKTTKGFPLTLGCAGALSVLSAALASPWAASAPVASAPVLLAHVVPGAPGTPSAPPPAPGQPGPVAPPGVRSEKEGAEPNKEAQQGPEKPKKKPAKPKKWYHAITRWIDPHEAPFIPVPEIAVDPDSGTTLGVIPTILVTDENDDIRKIIAPDLVHNPFFGWGVHGRIYNYTSPDEQWSIVSGIYERVQREFDGEFQIGRMRDTRWSWNGSAVYNVDGTPRFYGIGNESPAINQTDYTAQSYLIQSQLGYNFNHALQLQYTTRYEDVDVLPGTLARIASIQTLFATVLGEHTNKQVLNRLAVVYDTRDDIIIPSKGAELVAYGGLASSEGILNESLYSEAGFDGRAFFPVMDRTVIATHLALRYLLTAHAVPFWALSSIGGADTVIGGAQPLRGFGDGRFYDRDSFSSSVEFRRNVATFQAVATQVEIELAPFVDVGRVFDRSSTLPFAQLHKVYGVGFRGLARPYVVGFVDIGYGSEGAAVFTGINYPF